MRSRDVDRKWMARAVVLIAVLLAVVYLRGLGNPMLESDRTLLLDSPQLRGPGPAMSLFVSSPPVPEARGNVYAPVSGLSLATDRLLWGPSPSAWRITSLFLHGAASFLLFLLLLQMGVSGAVAVLAALLFALHPINTQAISVISSRGHILSGAFTLAAALFFVRALEKERPGWKRAAVPGDAWWALGLFAAGMFSGVEALAFPLVCLTWPWVAGRRYPHKIFYLGLIAVMGLYVVMGVIAGTPLDLGRGLWGGAAVIQGLRLIVAPAGQMVVHPMGILWSWGDPRFLAGIGVAVALLLVAVLLRGRRPTVPMVLAFLSCAVLAGLLAAAPHGALEEPGLYLATAAACAAAAGVLDSIGRNRAVRGAAVTALALSVAAVGIASSARCAVWSDPEQVWLEVLHKFPDYTPAKETLTAYYRRAGLTEKAAALVSPSEGGEHSEAVRLNNEGVALMDSGKFDEAATKLQQAVDMWPGFRDAHFNLGVVYHALGRPDSAEVHFRKTLEIDPSYANAHYNLAIVYDRAGDSARAEAEYREAVRLDPTHSKALANLGALEGRRGDVEQAIPLLERALQLDPGLLEARFNLALACEKVDLGRAREQWKIYLDLARARGVDPARIAQVEHRLEALSGDQSGD
jgi:Flp pilus assembly protein TadD